MCGSLKSKEHVFRRVEEKFEDDKLLCPVPLGAAAAGASLLPTAALEVVVVVRAFVSLIEEPADDMFVISMLIICAYQPPIYSADVLLSLFVVRCSLGVINNHQ